MLERLGAICFVSRIWWAQMRTSVSSTSPTTRRHRTIMHCRSSSSEVCREVLQALASHTWSHSIDIASTDAFANYLNTPDSVANPNIDRGNSDFDVRHAFTAGVTYNLPSPGWNNVAHAALGGWSVDGFIFALSAPPEDIVGAISFASGVALAARPNVVEGVPLELYGSQYPGGKIFNSAALTAAPSGQQGDFGRNVLRAF